MKSPSEFVLLSIQSEHASRIFSGDKRAELRKTFTSSARVVFLYETAPISAVTGAFVVEKAHKAKLDEAIDLAEKLGVSRDRASNYYGDRETAWVVTIAIAVKFGRPIPLADLRAKDHYFSPPQSFLHLSKYEGLTQDLIAVFQLNVRRCLTLRKLVSKRNRHIAASLIQSEIGTDYEDIDDDFVRQVMNTQLGAESAFSTAEKRIIELTSKNTLVGFTVVTVKHHGAWKTGPTILLPQFRGIIFGQELRDLIETYCRNEGARSIYCTCSANKPQVVAYLLNSGMQLQARLKGHLACDRDELVFAKRLRDAAPEEFVESKHRSLQKPFMVSRLLYAEPRTRSAVQFFIRHMRMWYFKPHDTLYSDIIGSLRSYEGGQFAYSVKGRALYGCFDASNKLMAVALLTPKRSGMLKINLVAITSDQDVFRKLISGMLREFRHYRRHYITLPTQKISAIQALVDTGFGFEGILQEPFLARVDHACFGRESSLG